MTPFPHIGICVPSMGTWVDDFGQSLALLMSYVTEHKLKGAKTQRVSLLTAKGSMLPQLRHNLVVSALQAECTHILFLDSDMVFPKNLLNLLYAHEKDFVGANCTTRRFPCNTTAHALDGGLVYSLGKTGLEEVRQTGMAVALIKTDPITQLLPPLFSMEWIPELNAYCGEDVYFCAKLGDVGVKLYVDHEVSAKIKHVGTYAYGHADVRKERVEVKHAEV